MPIIHYNSKTTSEALADKVGVTYGQFDTIADEAEKKAKENYDAYEADLVNFARLGYLYIGTIVAIAIFLVVFLLLHVHNYVGVKLTIFLGLFVFAILSSLWVKVPKPEGIELLRNDFPKLFSMLDKICLKLKTQADVVLLTDDYNAAVTQIPQAGFFGGTTNYLILGLPYMMAKSDKEFVATIAHEFGHLSSNHSKNSDWIYNLHKRWDNLLQNLDEKNILFKPFFAWYIPRFSAKSLVMNRKHELEADQFSIDIAGADARARSLVSAELKGHAYSNTWNDVFKNARFSPEAPSDVYDRLRVNLNTTPTHELRKWLNEALEDEGSKSDTHPPLKERLVFANKLEEYQNISDEDLHALVAPLDEGQSSSEIYLGDKLSELISTLNQSWYHGYKQSWEEKHTYFKEVETALQELKDKEQNGELNLKELKAKANLLEELDEIDDAIAVRHLILEKEPFHPVSNFLIGVYLVEKKIESVNNVDASQFLMRSYRHNLIVADSAHIVTTQHFIQQNREVEMSLVEDARKELEIAMKERATVKDTDEFLEHDLSDEEKEAFVAWLTKVEQIKSLYIVRKIVSHFPESKHYIIGLNVHGTPSEELFELGQVIHEHSAFIDYTRSIVIFDTWLHKLEKKIKAVPNCLIFKRKGKEIQVG